MKRFQFRLAHLLWLVLGSAIAFAAVIRLGLDVVFVSNWMLIIVAWALILFPFCYMFSRKVQKIAAEWVSHLFR